MLRPGAMNSAPTPCNKIPFLVWRIIISSDTLLGFLVATSLIETKRCCSLGMTLDEECHSERGALD
jgi:hypothetical protein